MYYIVRCPKCGRFMLFKPLSKNKYIWSKTCPYCGCKFKINLKEKPSWNRIIAVFDDPKKAQEYLKALSRRGSQSF